jgi:hypothetical protein
MLERKDDRRYAVTAYGQRCFSANKVLAADKRPTTAADASKEQ